MVATAKAPNGRAVARLNEGEPATAKTKMADQVIATRRWSMSPRATDRVPMPSALGPITVEATPCQRRANVDPYAKTLKALAQTKSHAAVTSQVTKAARTTCWRRVESG